MTCTCDAFYVGKTKRPFHKRIHDHIYYVPKLNTPIECHIGLKHNYNTLSMSFMALDHVQKDPRGVDFDKLVLQRETRWIHRLKAQAPPGLNDLISFAPYH